MQEAQNLLPGLIPETAPAPTGACRSFGFRALPKHSHDTREGEIGAELGPVELLRVDCPLRHRASPESSNAWVRPPAAGGGQVGLRGKSPHRSVPYARHTMKSGPQAERAGQRNMVNQMQPKRQAAAAFWSFGPKRE